MFSPEKAGVALADALRRVRRTQPRYVNRFPTVGVNDGLRFEHEAQNTGWLPGFWSGTLWLAHVASGDAALRRDAQVRLNSFLRRLETRTDLNCHLGLLYTLSARAQWLLTSDAAAHDLALNAAAALLSRYMPRIGGLLAWRDDEGNPMIAIECLMDLPLLWWAGAQSGDSDFSHAAAQHAETTLQHLLRPDGSAFHLMAYDGSSGALIGPQTTRAFNAETLWARGQAWAIYGFALAAEWTGETRYIEAATRAAARFMAELPTDGLPSWDLRLPPEADHLIDSSAAAIAAGGMLRLAAITAAHGRERLMASAYKLLEKLVTRCAEDRPEGEGLLRHGVYDMRRPLSGVDAYTVFGDYFYLETLLSVLGSAPDWWGLSSG